MNTHTRSHDAKTVIRICLFVVIATGLAVGPAFAECTQEAARTARGPVPLFVVTTSPEGFTQTKQTADSTKDLIGSLKGKKSVCLTDNREEALVVVEVLGREKAQLTATWMGAERDVTVTAKLIAGTCETSLSESAAGGIMGSGGAWGKAAGKLGKHIDQWVIENRARLVAEKQSK